MRIYQVAKAVLLVFGILTMLASKLPKEQFPGWSQEAVTFVLLTLGAVMVMLLLAISVCDWHISRTSGV